MKLGIVSDIHEDAIRLEEAIAILGKKACSEIACLGDIIGFSFPNFGFYKTRNAIRCVEIIKSNCKYVVAGNHDLFPVGKIPQYNAGFNYPKNWYELDYEERLALAGEEVWLNEENEFNTLIGKKEKEYILGLPEFLLIKAGNISILLSHFLYPDLSGSHRKFYENFGPVQDHLDFIKKNNCSIGFSGHKHVEGIYRFKNSTSDKFAFGKIQLDRDLQWIVGPCIANGKHENGFMVFDTNTLELEIIPLNTPKRMMKTVKA